MRRQLYGQVRHAITREKKKDTSRDKAANPVFRSLDEKYSDAECWESAPDAGDAQCVLVTAKNGSTFYPFVSLAKFWTRPQGRYANERWRKTHGCDRASASVTLPLSTTTSVASTSTNPSSPSATTTTSQKGSVTTSVISGSVRRVDALGIGIRVGCMLVLAAHLD